MAVVVAGILTASCDESSEPGKNNAGRTVLVYMIADNNLGAGGYDLDDIQEMRDAAKAGGIGKGRLLVYHSPSGAEEGTKSPALKEVLPTGEVVILNEYDNTLYSIDVERMKAVMKDVRDIAPSNEYGLVLWSHGNGWEEFSNSRAFGQEGSNNLTMKVSSLAAALDGFHHQFIYFDCCEMATVEVAYELRHATDYIIASGTELLNEGTRYDMVVPDFFANPFSPEAIARTTFDYFDSRHGYWRSCTMSVIKTEGLDRLADATREIMKTGAMPTVTLDGQQCYMRGVCSIYDMGRYIETLDCSEDLKAAWRDAFAPVVPLALTTPYLFDTFPMDYYCGLGTFILTRPADVTYRGYNNQQWWKDVVSYHPQYNPSAK
ncbi:MAG: hypothetical protein J1E63_01385 [Muribaculaceae bacterium]|nr:hypothetical protein [Muribaculaceae bacterium]